MVSISFIAGAGLGVAASVAAIFGVKWWRGTGTLHWRRPYVLAGAAIACFASAAGILYLAVGSHRSGENRSAETHPTGAAMPASAGAADAAAKSMDAEVAQLAARLARQGGSDGDWTLLAQAYDFLGRPDDAKRARAHIASPTTTTPVGQMSAAALAATADATAGGATRSGASAAVAAPAATAPAATVSQADLERRVKTNPRDAQAWLALADLRRAQRDYAGARDAYAKVIDLKAMSAQSWADYADVLGSLSGSLNGPPAQAIDQALALDGQNVKALWLRASLAHEQHHEADALKWWQKLRAALPAGSPDARIVDANIAEAATLAGVALPTASGTQAATATAATSAVATSGELSGTVSLDARFAGRVQPDATLFVYAKAVDSPGPPLAVWRTTAGAWPVSFHLDDSMAMIPSRRLSQFDKVVVEARISRTGQAMPSSGDLYVTSPVVRPSGGQKLALVINREIG
jgi:cytochrome c-type biogenesis protein CcmH